MSRKRRTERTRVGPKVRAAYRASKWAIRLTAPPLLARENHLSAAWGWLAVFAFQPCLGLLLYTLFGKPALRHRVRRHAEAQKELRKRGYLRNQRESASAPPPVKRELAHLIERLTKGSHGGIPAVGGNSAELITGAGSIDRMVADIERAERHVHLLFFIFNGDGTGWRVAEALAGAARRGVACRVLVDAFGSGVTAEPSFFEGLAPWLKEQGVGVRNVQMSRLTQRPFGRFDLRNHRKIAVVDGKIAYTGSLNIHDPGFALDGGRWRQMMVRLEGPVVWQLQHLFLEDWNFAADEHLGEKDLFPSVSGGPGLTAQIVPGGPEYGTDPIHHLLVAAIASSRERVVITTPYFVPDEPLQLALRVAAMGGTQVDLILPAASDRSAADAAARPYLDDLLRAGVHVHLFTGGMLHAKSMTVDDQVAIVGSANFDRRSLFLNHEANVVIYDTGFATHLRTHQEEYLIHSSPLGPDWWPRRPPLRRGIDLMAKLLSPLM